ncbi:hypothetical protein EJB05_15781, partial [Eragrostis curvula]
MAAADGHADRARGAAPGRRDRVAALLELAAADDAAGFAAALGAAGGEAAELADGVELWHGRSKAYEPRTPLMVAAACGSAAVVDLLLGLGCLDVNRRPGVDGATALHCAASGGSPNAPAVVRALLAAGADRDVPDSAGRVPADVVNNAHHPDAAAAMQALLGAPRRQPARPPASVKKEYPADPTLPDLRSSVYASDEFRMFRFKVQPCARAYAHDWTECPFLHPGENARRRDPRRHAYTAVPCASFRHADGCPRGDACDFAHGVFESWLHPSQYRTKLCRDGDACARRICFFAHADRELRRAPRDEDDGGVLLSPRAAADDMAALGLLPPAAHWLQQQGRSPAFNASLLDAQVDDLGALLDFTSLGRPQPRLSRRQPAFAPPSPYIALPPSRFGNDDHGGSAYYSPEAAKTSQLLARIRQQQGLRLPPAVVQRQMYDRSFSSMNKKQQHQMLSPPLPTWGYSDVSWINSGAPNSKVDWSFP